MTEIVLAAALLIAVVALAIAWRGTSKPATGSDVGHALRELLLARAEGRVSAEEFDQRQAALHAAVLQTPDVEGRGTGHGGGLKRWQLVLAVGVIAVAGALYGWLGAPRDGVDAPTVMPMQAAEGSGAAMGDGAGPKGGDLAVLVKRLAEKLEKDPQNGEGWSLLAHAYIELRQHKEADVAFAKAAALLPPNADMLADWADAHVVANDRHWDNKAAELVKKALAVDPKHLKALALAGSEAFDGKHYKEAIAFWKRMQAAAPADSMDAKLAAANIEEAEAVLAGKPLPSASAQPEAAAPSAALTSANAVAVAGPSISGKVTVAASAKGKVAPGDTVFVVVKSPDNSGPPLAVKRFAASELPANFTLGDGDAMMPNRKLSAFAEVVVLARLSKSGNAAPQPGDLASAPRKARLGATGLALELVATP